MSYEEEFDKIVRQKASEADYPFDENNWTKTSRMLDEQRKTASKLFWKKMLIPASTFVLVGIVGSILFTVIGNDADLDKNMIAANTVPAEQIVQNESEIPMMPSNKARKNESTVSNAMEESAIEKTLAASTLPHSTKNAVATNNIASAEKNQDEQTAIVKPEQFSSPEKSSIQKSSNPFEEAIADESVEVQETKIGNASNALVSENISDEAHFSKKNDVLIVEETLEQTTDESAVQLAESQEIVVIENLVPVSTKVNFSAAMPEIINSPLVILSRYEDDYYSKKKITHYLNIEAGAAYLLGWNSTDGKDGVGINWFGGLNYGYFICPKTSISLGIQLYNVSNIASPFYSKVDKNYGFGYSNSVTSITTDNLYYAALPLKFNYHLNSYNSFGLGLNAGYLVRAHSRVDTYTESDGVRMQSNSVGNNKIYNGTNSFNMLASVSYNTKINQRFGINAEFTYGLSDIFANNSLVNYQENLVGLRLSLNYYLINK